MKTKKINLTITGCLGRMGQQLIKSASKDKRFKINSLTENKLQRKKILGILPKLNSSEAFKKSDVIIDFTIPKCTLEVLDIAAKQKKRVIIGTTGFTENKLQRKKILGILPKLNSSEAFKKSDVIIDFTIPKCTLEVLDIAAKQKKRVIIGTTGFTLKEENIIKKISKKIPILKAGNMSLGINLLMYLTEIASKSLGNNFLSKVFEAHHKFKKDHPSGTVSYTHLTLPTIRSG